MKRVSILLFGGIFLALMSCERDQSTISTQELKETLIQNAATLNDAVGVISSTAGFKIFTVSDDGSKSTGSDSTYNVYIGLDQIKGIYDYKPVSTTDWHGLSLIKYFTRSADAANMVVKLPLKKVENPRSLRSYTASDTALANNFIITVSEYFNNYNNYHDYDYKLASGVSIDGAAAGNLNIRSLVSPVNGTDYNSEYVFTDGYSAKYKYLSGDTTVSSFGIQKNSQVLYEEKRLTIKNDTARFGREHLYVLTLGNIQIVRKSGVVAPAIYVDGVIQSNATVTVVDRESDPEATVCKKRDIQITFDDGTTTRLSTLIGDSVENIAIMFDSLHSVYFAAYIVDWIAYDIYYGR
jgi:hypothetical protein